MLSKRLETLASLLLACVAGAALLLAALSGLPNGAAAAQRAAAAQAGAGGQSAPPDGGATTTGGNGLNAPSGVLVRQIAVITGAVDAGSASSVSIERLDSAHATWTPIASATVHPDGSFSARWRADRIGKFTVRAVRLGGNGAAASSAPPTTQLTVYRADVASWFGPGFYGKRTACGEVMSPTLLGVAHRTLPCGTMVEVSYGGQKVTVPVVDRGPYVKGVSWDLTTATAKAISLDETARVGAFVDRSIAPAPAPATAGRSTASAARHSAAGRSSHGIRRARRQRRP